MLLAEYLLDMDSYQRIVEDGTITDDELVERAQRVASLLRRLEEGLSPEAEAVATVAVETLVL